MPAKPIMAVIVVIVAVHAVVGGACNWAASFHKHGQHHSIKLHNWPYMLKLRWSQQHWAWPEVIKNSLAHQVFVLCHMRPSLPNLWTACTSGVCIVSYMAVVAKSMDGKAVLGVGMARYRSATCSGYDRWLILEYFRNACTSGRLQEGLSGTIK